MMKRCSCAAKIKGYFSFSFCLILDLLLSYFLEVVLVTKRKIFVAMKLVFIFFM